MDNVTDLISKSDFLLLFVYAILSFFVLKLFVFKKMDKKFNRLFAIFFTCKVICAVLMSMLIVYYWGLSDNIGFYIEGKNIFKLIREDFSNIKYLFLPVENYSERIKFDNEMVNIASSTIESNFLAEKVTALLYPLALGRYLIINFFFALIATIGQLKFYIALSNRYPHIKKAVAIAILFMPSVLLYSSYLNKETLSIACMGFAFYNFFQLVHKRKRVANTLLLLLNIFFIGILKVYILVAFFSAVILVYFIRLIFYFYSKSLLSQVFITVFIIAGLWLLLSNLSYFDPYIADAATTSNTFQQQYNSFDETSSFEFGEIETSFAGLLKKAPVGIYTTYFRPHLWEINKPIILFSALESALVFVLTFFTIFSKRKYFRQLLKKDLFANISFYYILIFGMIVGLSTFNFGSLVRYKIPAVPFLMLFVFLLLNYKPAGGKDVKAPAIV